MILRQLGGTLRGSLESSRWLSTTAAPRFWGNFFGSKQIKQQEEVVKNQDDYEVDPNSKVVILNRKNSPKAKKFDRARDMPDFVVNQWKSTQVSEKDIENTYDESKLTSIINQTYKELTGNDIKEYAATDLYDLQFRFHFTKLLQKNLGFDIDDYTLTKSHTVDQLFNSLRERINKRWVSERNPNAIVLRDEDFTAPNVYLVNERTPKQQQALFNKLVSKAKDAKA